MEPPQPTKQPTNLIVLIVHGVGFFDEESISNGVKAQLDASGLTYKKILAFNWDSGTTTFFDRTTQGKDADLQFLADVGEGTLRATHLGFLRNSGSYAGLRPEVIKLQNALTLVLQVGCLVGALFVCLEFSLLWLPFIWLRTLILGLCGVAALIVALGLSASSPRAVTASLRRAMLTFIWPALYLAAATVATPYFLIIAILVVSGALFFWLGKSYGVALFSGGLNGFWDLLAYLSFFLLLGIVTTTVGSFLQGPAQVLFKIIADVVRYIGLQGYREQIHGRFHDLLISFADVPEPHLLILAHSLGSVIATDHLLTDQAIVPKLARLSVITMGSPIKRLFWRFFPEICPSPQSIALALSQRVEGFRWINLHRPFDYVGGTLFNNSSLIEEVFIPVWTRTHTNYWSEKELGVVIARVATDTATGFVRERVEESSTVAVWPEEITRVAPDSLFAVFWRGRDMLAGVLQRLLFPCVLLWGALCLYEIVHLTRQGSDPSRFVAGALALGVFIRVYNKNFRDTFVRPWLAVLLASRRNLPESAPVEAMRPNAARVRHFFRKVAVVFALLSAIVVGHSAYLSYSRRIWKSVASDAHFGGSTSLAFSENGAFLTAATGSSIETLGVSDTWQLSRIVENESRVRIRALSPDFQYALGYDDRLLFLYKVQEGQLVRVGAEPVANDQIVDAAVGAEGAYIAIVNGGRQNGSLTLRKMSTHQKVAPIQLESNPRASSGQLTAFSSDNKCLTVALIDSVVQVENLDDTQPQTTSFPESGYNITAVASAKGCAYVAVAYEYKVEILERKGRRYQVVARQPLGREFGNSHRVTAIAFSPRDSTILAASDAAGIELWNWRKYRYLVKPH
jgi:hypothetical protein